MESDPKKLIEELRRAGISKAAIEAAWPAWWSEEAAASQSGKAELRFALARKLGLSPKSLVGERVDFVWKDQAKFKNLNKESDEELAALASFGIALGRMLVQAAEPGIGLQGVTAKELRTAVLAQRNFVDLASLLATCWGAGIPVVHLRVFPLSSKGMHAMVVRVDGRHVILLGRDATYPAPVAFSLAHELGHISHNHLDEATALLDIGDPSESDGQDPQEREADEFALTLLTSTNEPEIETNVSSFSGASLAEAVMKQGPGLGIEPGTLALCVGHRLNAWAAANQALKNIYLEEKPVWFEVNGIAKSQLNWDLVGRETADYLRNVMSIEND